MARQSDTYTAAQAAQILGVSERRVRQLVAQGKLTGQRSDNGVVRVSQRAVNEERKRRQKATGAPAKRAPRSAARAAPEPVDVGSLAEAVASAVGQRLEGQLEITRRAESLVRQELDEERARRMQVEAQLQAAHARVAELEQERSRKRGLFRRSPA
jgi:excisionase family DNA binding protein